MSGAGKPPKPPPLPGDTEATLLSVPLDATLMMDLPEVEHVQPLAQRRSMEQTVVTALPPSPSSSEETRLSVELLSPGKGKKNPVAEVKARSRARVTPIDPGRRLVKEAAMRQAREGQSQLLDLLSGHGEQGEATIIGRFLGMVGLSQAGPAPEYAYRDPAREALELAARTPFFAGLSPQRLHEAIAAGELTLISTGRDMLMDTEGRALLVCEGQLALARFRPETLERERRAQRAYRPGDRRAEKREYKRRQEVGPMIRLCEANLALFSEGDLVGLEARPPEDKGVAVYTVTPAKVLGISRARLESWRRTYQFFSDRVRRAADAARRRIDSSSGARALIADFFVRHGLSVAMSLRVRELDRCIECYECERACEARYGAKRLSLNGKVLGALDFVDCCHTCVDQRCIDACAFDAIRFDMDKKEVLIIEEACTGCTLCAVACPYDAIEMHELDERPLLALRLQRDGKLGFGDGKPRKAQLRRIASKCDHCISYDDQACISACPTGALMEIPPEAAFIERPESLARAARGGFDHTAMVRADEIFSPRKFIRGMGGAEERARAAEGGRVTAWLWAAGLLGFLLCALEILLRRVAPSMSALFYIQTRRHGLEVEVALASIDYRPGSDFSVWLGVAGAAIMFSATLYTLRRVVPALRQLGTQRGWFEYHVFSGTVGPLFVLLHSAGKLDNWVSLAFWAMVATVMSGLIGRYLATGIPDLASQAQLEGLELERSLSELRNRHAGVPVADRFFERLRGRYARAAEGRAAGLRAGLAALGVMIRDDLQRPLRGLLLRRKLVGIKERKARRRVARLVIRLALLERRRLLLPLIEPLFREWKTIHVPFAVLVSVLSAVHIVVELAR